MNKTHEVLVTQTGIDTGILPPEERPDRGFPFEPQKVAPTQNALDMLMNLPENTDPELTMLVSEYAEGIYGMSLPQLSDAIEAERSAIVEKLKEIDVPPLQVAKLNARAAALSVFEDTQVAQNFRTWLAEDPNAVYAVDGVPLEVLKIMQDIHGDRLPVSSVHREHTSQNPLSSISPESELEERATMLAKADKKTKRSPGNPSQALVARHKAQLIDSQAEQAATHAIAADIPTTITQQIADVNALYSQTHVDIGETLPPYLYISAIDGEVRQQEAEQFFKEVYKKKPDNPDHPSSIVYLVSPSGNPQSIRFAVLTKDGFVSLSVENYKRANGLPDLRLNHQDSTAVNFRLREFNNLLPVDSRYTQMIVLEPDTLPVTIDTSVSTLAENRRKKVETFINAFATRENLKMRYLISSDKDHHLEIILPDKRTLRVSLAEFQQALDIVHIPTPRVAQQGEQTAANVREYLERLRIEGSDKPSIATITVAAETKSNSHQVKEGQYRVSADNFFAALQRGTEPEMTVQISGPWIAKITCNGVEINPKTFATATGMQWTEDRNLVTELTLLGVPLVRATRPVSPAFRMLRINGTPIKVRVTNK